MAIGSEKTTAAGDLNVRRLASPGLGKPAWENQARTEGAAVKEKGRSEGALP